MFLVFQSFVLVLVPILMAADVVLLTMGVNGWAGFSHPHYELDDPDFPLADLRAGFLHILTIFFRRI
jgi:hypothetical protein